MNVLGVTWSRVGGGLYMSPRFKHDLHGCVKGQHGAWNWQIEQRSPPDFKSVIVASGQERTQVQAFVHAAQVLTTWRTSPQPARRRTG